MGDHPEVGPEFSAPQREEIGRIEYFLDELRSLEERGLVSAEAMAAAEAEKSARLGEIERSGRAAGALAAARRIAVREPREALALAEMARGLDPGRLEAWALAAGLLAELGEFDRAIALCREGAEVGGHAALAESIGEFERRSEAQRRAEEARRLSSRAREALDEGDAEPALALAREALALDPKHAEAMELAVGGLLALGRLDEAGAACEVLRRHAPSAAPRWAARIREARAAAFAQAHPVLVIRDELAPVAPRPSMARAEPGPMPPPGPTWAAIAAEFLEEHWQKLILSLAVLLIVVSSTVGAALVLGDRLWMAEGKCLLATAYTIVFAGFGRWLSRWGADRAGRIMRLTTLMVLPVSFALVGELPALGRSSALSMAVLATDSAAMMAMVWFLCRSLGISGGRGTPVALIALGMHNALTTPTASFAWAYSAMLASALVFELAGEWLGAWLAARPVEKGDEDDAPYFAFGLLAFFFACAVGRIGGYVLHLHPSLYALAAMLAGASALRTADGLLVSGRSGRAVAALRTAGFAATALAFALGLARPPTRLPLFSGNVVAAAIAGMYLYSRALWRERRPAFLYAAFAALFLAYFGTHEFIKDVFAPVEGRVGRLLGYGGKLPLPFKALNALVFNALLAGLSIVFSRRWKDDRLAAHCHRIGLPLSIAACLFSCLEPLAGALTMGGYAIAFAIAAGVFARPALVYLGCAAFAGSAFEVSILLGEASPSARAISLAVVGALLWAACRFLSIERVPTAYREPILRSSRVVAALALAFAAIAAWSWESPTWPVVAALASVGILYVLIGLEDPRTSVASAATACAAVAILTAIRLAALRRGGPIPIEWFAAVPAALGLVYLAIASRIPSESGGRIGSYGNPLLVVGLLLAAFGAYFVALNLFGEFPEYDVADLAGASLALILAATALMLASFRPRNEPFAYPAVVVASGAALAALLAAGLGLGWRPMPARFGLACAVVGVAWVGIGDAIRGRREGRRAVYRAPLLAIALFLVALACLFGAAGHADTPVLTATLAISTLALALAVRQTPERPLPDLAFFCGLAAWLAGWRVASARSLEIVPRIGWLIAVYLAALLILREVAAKLSRRRGDSEASRAFAAALPDFVLLGLLAALGLGAVGLETSSYAPLTGVLALCACVTLGLTRLRQEEGLITAGLVLAWLATGSAVRWTLGASTPMVLGWLALTSADDVLIFGALWVVARRRSQPESTLRSIRAVGLAAAWAAFAMALAASAFTLDAYPPSVMALGTLVLALAIIAETEASPRRTYGAIVAAVCAAYLTMFELGRGRSGHVSALGVLATLLAIVLWLLERWVSARADDRRRSVFAIPLRDAAMTLAVLAILPDWGAPRALLLAGVPFLLLIASVPTAAWLVPWLALTSASAFFWVSGRWGHAGLVPAAVAAAFACWGLGSILGRWGAALCRRLKLPDDLALGIPPFLAAALFGLVTIGLRVDEVARHGSAWSASPWVPAALAVLGLLLLKPFPARVWVDAFAACLTFALFAAVAPGAEAPLVWALVGMTAALGWRLAERGASAVQGPVCARLGVAYDRVSGPWGEWSFVLAGLAAVPLVTRIGSSVLAATLGFLFELPEPLRVEWWAGLAAIALFAANLGLAMRAIREAWLRIGLHAAALLGLWWLVVPASPLARGLRLDPAAILPLITALHALSTSANGIRHRSRALLGFGFGVSIAGVILLGQPIASNPAGAFTLLLGAGGAALFAIAEASVGAAGLASVLWGAASLSGAWLLARRFGWDRGPAPLTVFALSQWLAALGLTLAAGWDRARGGRLAGVVERFAIAALLLASGAVGLACLAADVGPTQALIDVGAMFAVGALLVVLASRRGSLALAFAAQASLLLGYAAARSGFAATPAWDAAAMLLLAGVDLGVAEIAGRARRRLFALPAMVTGMALPIVGAALAMRGGFVGGPAMITLFAAGTFYAATGARLQWKGLGYAAAVLYNAALWVMWSRFGWEMVRDPQFFFVPVGFTTILFAEANRNELGRQAVNAIRGVGLTMMYLALAVPIWQTESLAAWAAVLLVSLVGIFAGIGLRSQTFLWLGLGGFVLDVVYQLGRIGAEHALAKWAIMLALGVGLVLFVALNEKKRIVETLRKYVVAVRQWE